jgi:hypothetical protein
MITAFEKGSWLGNISRIDISEYNKPRVRVEMDRSKGLTLNLTFRAQNKRIIGKCYDWGSGLVGIHVKIPNIFMMHIEPESYMRTTINTYEYITNSFKYALTGE